MLSLFLKSSVQTSVDALASRLHDGWREQYFAEHQSEPKMKQTVDRDWIARHQGKDTVDIAATPFEELPTDWQRENRDAARVAVGLLEDQSAIGGAFDDTFLEHASAIMHTKWLERAGDKAALSLRVPFEKLSTTEQKKDREQIQAAIEMYRPHI